MIIRIIIILVCVTFFINGCNSLISQFFGSHKLRVSDYELAAKEGIGDADFIELENTYLSGDFVYQESEYPNTPGVIIYPLLTAEQVKKREQGQKVSPSFIAWTADFHAPCVEENNCINSGIKSIKGVVREVPKDRQEGIQKLESLGYDVGEVNFINDGQEPVLWYWNALTMLIAAGIAVGLEAYYNRKNKHEDQVA